jgi:ubiquinone/menaquinone biosynthesis C-methylase UbiE
MNELVTKHFEKDLHYHEIIAKEYDIVVVSPRKVANDILFRQFSKFIEPGHRMLDIASGTGHMMMRFATRFSEVTAVDHSRAMLAQARHKAAEGSLKHIKFIEQDVLSYLANEKQDHFDFVTCVGFLHHLPVGQIPKVIANILKLIRKSGVLLLSEPVKVDDNAIPQMIREWNRHSLAAKTGYSVEVEEPDEEPLDPSFLIQCVSNTSLLLKVQRSFEIFPHRSPPSYRDILAIKLMNRIYGRMGNVMTIASRKI